MNDFENLATIYDTIKEMPVKDIEAEARAIAHQNQLTKPPGALGILEELAVFLASWQRKTKPLLNSVQAIVFAGNHGICSQGVNPFPQDVTIQMVENFKTCILVWCSPEKMLKIAQRLFSSWRPWGSGGGLGPITPPY